MKQKKVKILVGGEEVTFTPVNKARALDLAVYPKFRNGSLKKRLALTILHLRELLDGVDD